MEQMPAFCTCQTMENLPRKAAVLELRQRKGKVKCAVGGRVGRSELIFKTIRAQMIPSGTPDVGYGTPELRAYPIGFC